MKTFTIFLLLVSISKYAGAQQVVVDYQHLVAVTQNGAVRSAAENTHDQYLGKINNNINDLNTNVGSVIVAQTMIFESLSNVNSALKNGLTIKNIAVIVADMTMYINQALAMAKSEPYLLIFSQNAASEMRLRSTALVGDISAYILKEGNNVLADYNSRDQLLRKVAQQLQILDGLAYGAWKSMYWAKERGIIASATPFADYVNHDKIFVSQIIQNAKYLKP